MRILGRIRNSVLVVPAVNLMAWILKVHGDSILQLITWHSLNCSDIYIWNRGLIPDFKNSTFSFLFSVRSSVRSHLLLPQVTRFHFCQTSVLRQSIWVYLYPNTPRRNDISDIWIPASEISSPVFHKSKHSLRFFNLQIAKYDNIFLPTYGNNMAAAMFL